MNTKLIVRYLDAEEQVKLSSQTSVKGNPSDTIFLHPDGCDLLITHVAGGLVTSTREHVAVFAYPKLSSLGFIRKVRQVTEKLTERYSGDKIHPIVVYNEMDEEICDSDLEKMYPELTLVCNV